MLLQSKISSKIHKHINTMGFKDVEYILSFLWTFIHARIFNINVKFL